MFWVYVTLAALVDSAGIILTKHYAETGNLKFILSGMFCFALMAYFLGQSMTHEKMAIAIIIWAAFSLLVAFFVGWIFFEERLTSLEMLGFLVILVGLLLVKSKEFLSLFG